MTREQKHIENASRYAALKAAGLCVGCKADATPGRVRCPRCDASSGKRSQVAMARHRARARELMRVARVERKDRGQCPRCGQLWRGRTLTCRPCLIKQRTYDRDGRPPTKKCGFCAQVGHNVLSCQLQEQAARAARVAEAAGARVAA